MVAFRHSLPQTFQISKNRRQIWIHLDFHVHLIMKTPSKLLLSAACSLVFACPAFSQTIQRYAFDNFDAASGVHIQVEPEPVPKPGKKHRRHSARIAANDDPFVKKTDLPIPAFTPQP